MPAELRLNIFGYLFVATFCCHTMIVGPLGVHKDHRGEDLPAWERFYDLITKLEPIGAELFEVLFKNT
jgi:hypothetical protein